MYAPVHALWRLRFKKNDANLLLLVRPIFFKKYYNMVKLFAASIDTLKNILTTETTTGTNR